MGGRPDSLERLHAELMGTLRRLPRTPAVGFQSFGPAADEVERFVSLLRDQPATVWERAEEYRHNLELNPAVHEELVSKHRSLLDLGMRTGRSAALRSAAEAALDALPTRIHAAWELATILAAWAVALSDLLPAAELQVFCRPFEALRADAPDVSRPPPGLAQPPAPSAAEVSRAEGGSGPVKAIARQTLGLAFADVGGLEDVKARLRNALGDVLANPQVAAKLRVRVGGILLYGPPGNGKSYLARATAGEASSTISSASVAAMTTRSGVSTARSMHSMNGGRRHRVPVHDRRYDALGRESQTVGDHDFEEALGKA
jgi:ATPase family associated with various cellular activities (AAA)